MEEIIKQLAGSGVTGLTVAINTLVMWYLLTKDRPKILEDFRKDVESARKDFLESLKSEREFFATHLQQITTTFNKVIDMERELYRGELAADRKQYADFISQNQGPKP